MKHLRVDAMCDGPATIWILPSYDLIGMSRNLEEAAQEYNFVFEDTRISGRIRSEIWFAHGSYTDEDAVPETASPFFMASLQSDGHGNLSIVGQPVRHDDYVTKPFSSNYFTREQLEACR